MPVTESTPATPEPPSDGVSAAPDEPVAAAAEPVTPGSETPTPPGPAPEPSRDQANKTPPANPPGTSGPGLEAPDAPSGGGGRGGCMATMMGLFLVLAALLGIATQL